MDPDRHLGVTAMTGSAAVLIGGTTLHSYLGIGLGKDSEDDLVKKIKDREKLERKWCDTNILVVDEVSMLPADLFDKLNGVAKRVRKRSEPFGGMQLVFGGDFLQLPCVKGDFCFESKAWRECGFEIFHLTKIMRQSNKQFQACLNRARFGEMTDEDFEYITQSVPTKEKIASMEIKPTRILCENVDVNEINQTKLEQLPVEEIYKYKYKIEYNLDNYEPRVHQFMFKDVTKLCNAQPKLSLSVGAQVMLLVNLDVKGGLVNGSRGVVTRFIECKIFNNKGEEKIQYKPMVRFNNGHEIAMNRHGYEVKDGKYLIATVFQIPLKLAYAITVHKSQGMTLDSAIINLKGVFEYGQAYVALSRVKDINNLFLKNVTKSTFKAHPKALEFYRQLDVVVYRPGDITDPLYSHPDTALVQIINCVAVRPHGLSNTLAKVYPYCNSYSRRRPIGKLNRAMIIDRPKEGTIQVCLPDHPHAPIVINVCGQFYMGKNIDVNIYAKRIIKQYLDDHLQKGLQLDTSENRIKWFREGLAALSKNIYDRDIEVKQVVFPAFIGCGLAGGNWQENYLPAIRSFARRVANYGVKVIVVKFQQNKKSDRDVEQEPNVLADP